MTKYSNLTKLRDQVVDDLTPWVLRDKFENEQSWDYIVNDWHTIFRSAVIDNVANRGTVVQAGGWQGLYPALLSNLFETVYTFEPDPVNFYCLTQNCQKDNIHKFQSTLSDKCGVVTFEEVISTGQGRVEHTNSWSIPVEKRYTVPTLTIDSLNLPQCDLIMLDVESFEYPVLLGAIRTIREFSPVVITEKNFRPDDNLQTIQLMNGLGYYVKHEYPCDIMFAAK
jgi:FkbM family methyltransferase